MPITLKTPKAPVYRWNDGQIEINTDELTRRSEHLSTEHLGMFVMILNYWSKIGHRDDDAAGFATLFGMTCGQWVVHHDHHIRPLLDEGESA